MAASFGFASCVRGYHVYQEIWTATEGETMICSRETRSREDPFAVAVVHLVHFLLAARTAAAGTSFEELLPSPQTGLKNCSIVFDMSSPETRYVVRYDAEV